MSADFWAGYISGAVGIIIGNPLDIIKVRLQARSSTTSTPSPSVPAGSPGQALRQPPVPASSLSLLRKFSTGTAAPILGYGALNALLFVSYNRSEAMLNHILSLPPQANPLASDPAPAQHSSTTGANLWTTFLAGAIGGLTTWVVSTPMELVKCRAQLALTSSSWHIARRIWCVEGGPRGFYFGGAVTALRDSIGYGFYFWSYELTRQLAERWSETQGSRKQEDGGGGATNVLLCGGIAGIVTWASIFPLDVIKTRVQAQAVNDASTFAVVTGETRPLLGTQPQVPKRMGAMEVAKEAYRDGGLLIFFRGLTVCSIRAFVVNAVQWATYEWIMSELGQGRKRREVVSA